MNAEAELKQYIETALWSSTDEQPDGNGGPPMDDKYGAEDLAPGALTSMREDIESFLNPPSEWPEDERALITAALDYWEAELGAGQVGHDFWLTRNGHGAGFWDRFSDGIGAAHGDVLTAASKPYGESYVYAGDDGRVYVG